MGFYDPDVIAYVLARERDGAPCRLAPSALADGPVADTPEPLAAEAGRPITEPDRDDTDTVTHE